MSGVHVDSQSSSYCHSVSVNMPSVLLSNVNRITNKLDELSLFADKLRPDIIALTETWLSDAIPDSFCSLSSYNAVRLDRQTGQQGGGIMFYVRDNLSCRPLSSILNDRGNLEVLFISVRPRLLPRPLTILIFALVYCPPWYDAATKRDLCKYLTDSCDCLSRKYPSAGFFILGDFNNLDTSIFNRYLCFRQLVKQATRGKNILDKIFTNCGIYFSPVSMLAPIGKSDHNCILLTSQGVTRPASGYRTVVRRRIDECALQFIGSDILKVNWYPFYNIEDCQTQANCFYDIVYSIIDKHAPERRVGYKNNDRPWVNDYFKRLVSRRNTAYKSSNRALYKELRNRVNRVGRTLKSQYFLNQVEQMKSSKPKNWWKEIKRLSGALPTSSSLNDNLTLNDQPVDSESLSEVINNFFVSVSDHVRPIESTELTTMRANINVQPLPDSYIVSEYSVYYTLKHLKASKASCDERLHNKVLIELADVLSGPICALINSSIRQGVVPTQWRQARVSPIPKVCPPAAIETDLRPISVTSGISKVAESFICQFFNWHFSDFIDNNQFGSTRNRSTTHALVKFSDFIFSSSDSSSNIIRILLVDFKKAFDVVDHNILSSKFKFYDFPSHVSTWLLSFLQDRSQYCCINNVASNSRLLHAGTPQGTLSGPNLFKLLINDLDLDSWLVKYVDDTTAVSVSDNPLDRSLQSAADRLTDWCTKNKMLANPVKTKEVIVYFGKKFNKDIIPVMMVDGQPIERTDVFKLLGVVFSSNLSWSNHILHILGKVSKRYIIIFELCRIGVNQRDIVMIYCAVIRSVLEYACPVWHSGLTTSQSTDIERVQKRCLRLIYPDHSYREALVISGLERLSDRRDRLTRQLFDEMKNPAHILNTLLPLRQMPNNNIRRVYPYSLPKARTSRYTNCFIPYCIRNRF